MNAIARYASLARRARRPVLTSLAAGGVYGGWAGFVHHSLGARVMLHAGLTQAALSTATTLVLTLVLERLFRWAPNPLRGFWFAPVSTTALATTWLVVGNALAGTPHIALAIAPSVVVGAGGSFVYAYILLSQARKER